ncbi:class I tRNA ligase family protein, partial [Candidatus Woesearchaeota archaeon]|nr:class I tRNA ligase family protein [Candidatus Woesearchaeota archaeon]
MFKKGITYKKGGRVNWCPECNTVLANEQVVDGNCWRHEKTEVEQKELEQWYIKITDYADELLKDLDKLTGWPERVKTMQRNWIGRSEGSLIEFKVKDMPNTKLTTFTTRPDTAFGITYLVIAAEHPIIDTLIKDLPEKKQKEVRNFIKETSKRTVIDRTAEGKAKTGVALGRNAINPLTGEEIPLWVADYALVEYGTGMVMAVPAHDQRDFEFAKKYKLPIKVVINPQDSKLNADKMARAFVDNGIMVNSGEFDGENNRDAIKNITKKLVKLKAGEATINYKLRDWLVSRQRYWGTPIPIIYCDKCGIQAAPQDELPILLPENPDF